MCVVKTVSHWDLKWCLTEIIECRIKVAKVIAIIILWSRWLTQACPIYNTAWTTSIWFWFKMNRCLSNTFTTVFKRFFEQWIEYTTFFLVYYRLIEVFSFIFRQIFVVFWIHNLEIVLVTIVLTIIFLPLNWIWVDRLTSIPVIFYFFVIERIVPNTIWRCFINVFEMISILNSSFSFIKEFLIMSMSQFVIHTICDMGSVIPCLNTFRAW